MLKAVTKPNVGKVKMVIKTNNRGTLKCRPYKGDAMGEFVLGQGPGHKFETAVGRNNGSMKDVDWLSSGKNFNFVILLRTGRAELVMRPEPTPVIEVGDSIVRVDRTSELVYPGWVKEVLYPELENTGPAEYDATKLTLFLLPDQEIGIVTGKRIYQYFSDGNLLQNCLGFRDLLEIQKKGVNFFQQNWNGKVVYGWRSVVRDHDGDLYVPYLCVDFNWVVEWRSIKNDYGFSKPALCFAD
jgi:hypothetical protein